ncbi:MAG: alpha/beta hydrolase fold domain-containing protein [Pikeienuella sp.]
MPHLPPDLVNLALRIAVKPRLARVSDPMVLRKSLDRAARRLFRSPPGVRRHWETVPGEPPLRMLGLEPAGAGTAMLLYFHGGVYVAGSPDTHAHLAARIAQAGGMRALLPAYRRAPEHPFPAALDDALAAYRTLLDRGLSPDRIALAGDSAGGGLAAALLVAIEAAALPGPAALAVFSPWADMTGRAPSLRQNARKDPMLPAHRLHDAVEMVLQGADPTDPRASPALARYGRPPPALIFASEDEILRDDAKALAAALASGGAPVRLVLKPRLPHAWPVLADLLSAGERTARDAGRFLAGHLA